MATHSSNSSHSTLIKDSTIDIDTLNVNKTSTHEEIINALPAYYSISPSKFENPTSTASLDHPVDVDFLDNMMVFVNGVSLSKLSSHDDTATSGYFITADGNYLTIIYPSGLSTAEIHALYTSRNQ